VNAQEKPMPKPGRARSNSPDFPAAPVSPVKDFRTFLAEENPGHNENDFVASMVEAGQTDFDKIGSMLGYYAQGQRYDTLYTQYLKQSRIQRARKPEAPINVRPSSPDNKKMHASPEQKQAEPHRASARSNSTDFPAAPVSPVKDFRTFLTEENPGRYENDFVAAMVEAGQTDFTGIGNLLNSPSQGERFKTLYARYLKQSKPAPETPIEMRQPSSASKKMAAPASPKQKPALTFRKYLEDNNSTFTEANETAAAAVEMGFLRPLGAGLDFKAVLNSYGQARKYNDLYKKWQKLNL